MRLLIVAIASAVAGTTGGAQLMAPPPILLARATTATVALKIFNPSGSIRLVGWDRDSVVIRGRVSARDHFFYGADSANMKFGIEGKSFDEPAHSTELVVYLPRRGSVSVKSVDANVSATDVAGWFYSVSGAIVLSGAAANVDAESMSGDIMLDLTTPWVRAHTGKGHLVVRGSPQDVDVSTVSGALDVLAPSIMRGRFASVTGDIRYMAAVPHGGLFEFSNHSGTVDFALPRTVSAALDLASVSGLIDDEFMQVKPVAAPGHRLHARLGNGDAQIVARTFKGAIRVRPL